MGKREIEHSIKESEKIISEIRKGIFSPLYLIMGDEPYYSDLIIDEIEQHALTEEEKSFNYLLLYGSETTTTAIVEAARRFPMMASRQLVIVKEAQQLNNLPLLEHYFKNPLSTTLLLLSFNGKSIDKRSSLYKLAKANGTLLESYQLYPNMLYPWALNYLKRRGVSIQPEAVVLLTEHYGTELRKLSLELDKLITNLSPENSRIDLEMVEKNSGINRLFNKYELTKALSFREKRRALQIAQLFGESPQLYPLPETLSALFYHFVRILKYHSLHQKGRRADQQEIATALGLHPYFLSEYLYAAKSYPLIKTMEIISLIRIYDSRAKGMGRGEATDGDLLRELILKILG